ncbi:diguanylate cyclase domain-containing protein [Parashewanella tropica]|uniref:diguanylate cyclase domain-containing protein n=1 Tax=Parashewanella tropica TaxID=2547970 RepID=UPI0014781F63|nr:diguanylate cyclase [Parashewanella tropica]
MDQETGVYNQAYFIEAFNREWQKHLSQQKGLALLYLCPNMDETSNSNTVLKILSVKLQSSFIRSNDLLARSEKGYFTIGLFDLDIDGLQAVLKRINTAITEVKHDTQTRLNQKFDCRVIAGHCTPTTNKQSDGLINQVEQALHLQPVDLKKPDKVIYWE